MKLISVFLLVLIVGTYRLKAEFIPGFDMETCVGQATGIVRGDLNVAGDLTVTEVLTGKSPDVRTLKLDVGQYHFERLQKLMGRGEPLEVIAFLKEGSERGWNLVLQYAGLVGLDQDKAFLYGGSYGFFDSEEPVYTRASFLQALRESIQTAKELDILLAKPPSIERARDLVSFALTHEQFTGEQKVSLLYRGPYRLGRIATALKEQGLEGQKEVLQAISLAKTPQDQTTLVTLAGSVSLDDQALEVVSSFLSRTNPAALRVAAMEALNAINAYRAVGYLEPYLVLDDPQLTQVLDNLEARSYPPQEGWLNVQAVEALKRLADSQDGWFDAWIVEIIKGSKVLAESVTGRGAAPSRTQDEPQHTDGMVSRLMAHYAHPKLMPLLYRRAVLDGPARTQSLSVLYELIGLKYKHDDRIMWAEWWSKAQPLLEGDFNLQTPEGRETWMDHYWRADPGTRKVLMNLWFFEPWIDEQALIEAAMQQDAAKQVLSELWRRRRLSPAAKQAIVQHFLTFKLVNHPPQDAAMDKTSYGASIEETRSFPFPTNINFRARSVVTLGDQTPDCEKFDWNWRDPQTSGRFSSPPQARAEIEYYESDFPYSHAILWQLKWDLGPTQLSNGSQKQRED